MYDIKQFLPTLYVLVLVGITGFAISSDSPGLWVLSVSLVLINAWFIKTGQFKPLGRLLANLISILACVYWTVYLLQDFSTRSLSPIITTGQFLVMLQLVKLWEQRGNRDYAQLLGLSLLLMVAASISTASLVFGILLIGYLFLSLYCSLLFHLKVETDEAKAALAIPEHRLNPATLKQDQRYLVQSMRRLTALVSVVAIACAVAVFLFFPRVSGTRLFAPLQWRPQEAMTGFSDHVGFQQVASIARNDDPVATVKVWRDGQPVYGTESLRLRGVTLDYYNGDDDSTHAAFQWTRSSGLTSDQTPIDIELHDSWHPQYAPFRGRYLLNFRLNPTGSDVLFSLAGPVRFTPLSLPNAHHIELQYCSVDEVLQSSGDPLPQIEYNMEATGVLGHETPYINREHSHIDPLITQYANRPEVSGAGLIARRQAFMASRPATYIFHPTIYDEQIARNIEQYLRNNFSYTLDLTNAGALQRKDPLVAFLYDFKRGHCEYFAGAMTLMCQSLGIESRMVVGFVCDDYNTFGNYYQVRQSQAHAWVEVYTPHGWVTFDPTSGHEAGNSQAGAWKSTKHFLDYLQYTWANAVVAYDADNRENLVQNVETRMTNTAINGSMAMSHVRSMLDALDDWLGRKIIGPVIIILTLALIGAIGWFFFERWDRHRRASRIGVESLPISAQNRLIRQLTFYDDLLRLLERHQIIRPKHLTPLEFSESLTFLPAESYNAIRRLTSLFYRIRYGHAELHSSPNRHLENVIGQIANSLSGQSFRTAPVPKRD